MEEVLLLQVHHEFLLWGGCNNEAKSRYNTKLANLLPRHIYSPCVVNWDVLNGMGCDGEIDDMLRIKLRETESNEKIFTYVAWIRAFNIKEPIYAELCHEFYSTYEFNKVCVDDELQTKKIIKFRLSGRAYNLTLSEFAHRLGLYHADELEEDVFDVYFQGGLGSDEHFNAQEYWLSISREGNLRLSRSHFYYPKPDFEGNSQDDHLWFVSKNYWIARKARVLTDVVLRSLSALIYCRDLDMTTLRELIDYEGRLIPEDLQPGVPRVGIPRPQRASMQLIEIVLFIVDSGCSKHMTGNLKLLINFVEKFLGTVKFGNDQIAPILGYGDLVNFVMRIWKLLSGSQLVLFVI
uniref:Retrotransposon Orf1 n=1 Tax=Tanacetum cinerariifolium TaxID=118510 RepID=A0A6L2P5T5_TANCI|nr:retrotransposon Orf1 [Tanacetum cinerariifolium]